MSPLLALSYGLMALPLGRIVDSVTRHTRACAPTLRIGESKRKTQAKEPGIMTTEGSRQARVVSGGIECVCRGPTTCVMC